MAVPLEIVSPFWKGALLTVVNLTTFSPFAFVPAKTTVPLAPLVPPVIVSLAAKVPPAKELYVNCSLLTTVTTYVVPTVLRTEIGV